MTESAFDPVRHIPRTIEQVVLMLECWGWFSSEGFRPEKAAQAANLLRKAQAEQPFRENIEYLLARCPYTIRVREGGGPESVIDSLIATFMKMEIMLKEKK
jgi:hypothetical protein